MPQARTVMRSVQYALDNLQIQAAAPNAEWTAAIKTALCDLGRTFQYWVYAHAAEIPEANRDGGEWLYDVTWLDYAGDDLVNVPLVAECEWQGGHHMIDDFQKLLLSRADLRLMIFDGSHQPGSLRTVENLARQVAGFAHSREDDSWLFAAWEPFDNNHLGWVFNWFTRLGAIPSAFPASRPNLP